MTEQMEYYQLIDDGNEENEQGSFQSNFLSLNPFLSITPERAYVITVKLPDLVLAHIEESMPEDLSIRFSSTNNVIS